jgi:tripartite motif-containing protein 71
MMPFITKWGFSGSDNGQFSHPSGVAVGSSGNVYVDERDRIQKFTSDDTVTTKLGSNGTLINVDLHFKFYTYNYL